LFSDIERGILLFVCSAAGGACIVSILIWIVKHHKGSALKVVLALAFLIVMNFIAGFIISLVYSGDDKKERQKRIKKKIS
jgi:hypothetical protein